MKTVNDYVFKSIINYPSLFNSRESVLIHAFLVIGNGVEWSDDGYMYNLFDNKTVNTIDAASNKCVSEANECIKKELSGKYSDEIKTAIKRKITNSLKDELDIIKNADWLSLAKAKPSNTRLNYYAENFTLYSNFFNVPINVADDWLEAMYDVVDYITIVNPYHKCYMGFLVAFEEYRRSGDIEKFEQAKKEIVVKAKEILNFQLNYYT